MDQASWREMAERDLKGRSLDRLTYRPEPDIDCGPLCSDSPPSSRGLTRAPGWLVLQTVAGSAGDITGAIQAALKGGADAIRLDCTTLRDARDLATCLKGVDLSRIPIHLAGEDAGAAAATIALWRALGLADDQVQVHFGIDPVADLVAKGALMGSIESRVAAAAEVGRWTSVHAPKCRAITVDAGVWHRGGADEAWSIALGISTALSYVRAMESAGVEAEAAFAQIALRQEVPGRFLLGIAKLRATRRVWARIAEVTGVNARLHQTATAADRERTDRDRWVNLLRHTASAFGGIIGGADAIDLPPYAARDAEGERLARNIQLVLRDEAHLGIVADPAGGAHAIETLTDQVARAAWKRLQQLERQGGAVEAITSGHAAEVVGQCRARIEGQVRRRKRPILGVSRFPNLAEDPGPPRPWEEAPTATPGGLTPTKAFDDLLENALNSPIPSMSHALGGRGLARAPAVPSIRLAEPFELLRRRGDRLDSPALYLATVGELVSHGARLQFGHEFARAGGLRTAEGVVGGFAGSGCSIAVLVGNDVDLAEQGAAAVQSLIEQGAKVWCLGRPAEHGAVLDEAGVLGFLYAGIDVVSALQELWAEVQP